MALQSHYQETSTFVTSSFSDNGDYIGTESSFEVLSGKTDVDVRFPSENKVKEKTVARDVTPPPPMMLSASSHVPWVLKREYTSDGRLLLTQEKASRHEYLQAHRSNGRLTLQLVSLNDDDDDDDHDPVENGSNSCFLEGKSR